MRDDRARIADLGQPLQRNLKMRMRRVGIAAQRVDDEQAAALEEVNHFFRKICIISGICNSVSSVAEDKPSRLYRLVLYLDRRHFDRPDRMEIGGAHV